MKTIGDEARSQGRFFLVGGPAALIWGLVKSDPIFIVIGTLWTISAPLLLLRNRAGIITHFAPFVFLIALFSWQIATQGFSAVRIVMVLLFLFMIWAFSRSMGRVLRGTATWDDPAEPEDTPEDEGHDEDEDEADKPLISIVLLQRQLKFLDEKVLAHIVESAWGGDFTSGDEEASTFVVGETPLFMVRSESAMWGIHNFPEPYADKDEMMTSVPELRLRKAIEDHEAWLAVDLMVPFNENLPRDVYYPYIFQLIGALADEDTLAILRPETGQINVWSEEILPKLFGPDPLLDFNEPENPEVIPVDDNDPIMIAATQEARDRFPEFAAAYHSRRDGDAFSIKAPIWSDDHCEFIWVDVTGLEPEYIHGTLANHPVALGVLKLGSVVEVPLAELNDWCIMKHGGEEPIGLFTVQAVAAAAKRQGREE